MKRTAFVFFPILLLSVSAGSAMACHSGSPAPCRCEDASAYLRIGERIGEGGYLSGDAEGERFLAGLLCPDLASTGMFEREDLRYVHTMEFAEAVYSVASGASRFSPREIPGEWREIAYAFGTHLAASGPLHEQHAERGESVGLRKEGSPREAAARLPDLTNRLREDRNSCGPLLLFRASLEYRSQEGHEGIPLLYPHKVRNGVAELSSGSGTGASWCASTRTPRTDRLSGTRLEEGLSFAVRWLQEHP